jgi:anti-sigma factor RsiW
MTSDASVEHLSEHEVVAYLSRALTSPERARVASHLADCADCRREIVAVVEILTSYRRRRARLRLAYLVGALAVAALAVLLAKSIRRVR